MGYNYFILVRANSLKIATGQVLSFYPSIYPRRMNYKIIYGILCILCFALAIHSYRKGHPFTFLALVIFNCGLMMFDLVLNGLLRYFNYSEFPILSFSNLMFPLGLLIFFRNLHTTKISKYDKWLLVSACLEYMAVVVIYPLYLFCGNSCFEQLPSNVIIEFFHDRPFPEGRYAYAARYAIIILFFHLQLIIFPFVLYQIWQELKKAKERHFNFFTQDSFEFYTWNFRFIVLVALCYVIVGSIIYHDLFFEYIPILRRIAYTIIGLGGIGFGLLCYLSPAYLRKERDFPKMIKHFQKNDSKNGKDIDSSKYEEYKTRLTILLENKKIYTDPNLTLTSLAEHMNISSRHLSRIINKGFSKSFSDFINGYRVEEVKKNLLEPDYAHYNILSIGLEAGFNSKSSFYTAFKKETGTNPAQYKKLNTLN